MLNLEYTSSNDNVFIVPNGVYMSNQCHGPNHNDIFFYGSSPIRGLEQILNVWPLIKKHLPTAVLEVYYGFNSNVDKQLGRSLGSLYEPWKLKILKLLEQEGVVYMQSVDHNTLMTAMSRSGWILYPTRFQETGCITMMKAMACGSIPITSRFTDSVLFNLTNGYDLGPNIPLNITISKNEILYDKWIYEDWLPSVLGVSTYSYDEIKQIRKKMKKYGRSLSWERSAIIMSPYFI
jgi:glycosyltransferase involved in cell wall biosynthesis